MKLELLDPKVLLDPVVRWEHLDLWVLLAWWGSEDVLDLGGQRGSVVNLVTSENTVQWVLWVSADPLDTQELRG